MPEHDESSPKPKKRSKAVTAIAWCAVALLVPLCSAWISGRWSYWFDLIASQQIQIGWAAIALGCVMLIGRRRLAGSVCIALAIVSLYPVLAGRIWSLPRVDFERKSDGVIRTISWNINPLNEHWLDGLNQLLNLDADIVIVIEASPEMSRSVHHRNAVVDDRYPYRSYRKWVQNQVSAGIVFSRWPIQHVITNAPPSIAGSVHYQRVECPSGNLIIGLLHPASPREKSRWITGNEIIESQAQVIEQISNDTRVPILIGTDLNAGPAQLRARTLRKAGLRMSKPVLHPDGSFPANTSVPPVLRVQLDDVWSLGNIEPIAWKMIELVGSDHQAVIVDFKIVGEPDS